MSDTLIIPNSIWPNGMKVDSDGYAVFYPLGTNKINVPTSSSEWPKGNKLVSPFVYQDDKLVGLIDTKALITDSQTSIYLPYEHIEAEFSEIKKGQLQIHAPNAITKKASWKDSGIEDIAEVQFKYKNCYTKQQMLEVDSNYLADIKNGTWSEPLWHLEQCYETFASCANLIRFNSDLPRLFDGTQMFEYCENLTSFNNNLSSLSKGSSMFAFCYELSAFNCDLPNLTNGDNMFQGCKKLTSFTSDLPKMTDGYRMFDECSQLTSFTSDLPKMTDGSYMFYRSNLELFSSDLSSLENGDNMFSGCYNLTAFSSDVPNLTNGEQMFFWCKNLTSFNSDLSSLTNGESMFENCENLTSFSSDLSSLTNGYWMFYGCYNIKSFSSDLSSLTNGVNMFSNCYLNTASVQNIADTINTYNGIIHIGIDNSEPNSQKETAFNTIASKGWTVYVNGSQYTPTSPAAITTLDETGEETVTPIPFWAKPVQSDEEHAQFVDAQGNFYNILGGQFIYGDDLSTYGMFTCEEDAAANMRLTPYTKPQTEIENQ